MERFTKEMIQGKNTYWVDEEWIEKKQVGYGGKAIDRLAGFENAYEMLRLSQEKVLEDMEKLRAEGKSNTISFKQLMGKKLTNINTLAFFELYEL